MTEKDVVDSVKTMLWNYHEELISMGYGSDYGISEEKLNEFAERLQNYFRRIISLSKVQIKGKDL